MNGNIEKDAFQSAIRTELLKSGIIRNITTELRRQICNTLTRSDNQGVKVHRCKQRYNLEQAAIRSLVMEYLLSDELEKTASVFSSESCLDEHILSRTDALKSYSVVANSHIHSMLMRANNESAKCYEDTCIHILLSHASQLSRDMNKQSVTTQTISIDDDFKARKQLDKQLDLINEKFKNNSSLIMDNKRQIEERMELKLQSIQKECEKLAEIEMERKLKEFKDKTLLSIQKEQELARKQEILEMQLKLKKEYEAKHQEVLDRENETKKRFDNKELQMESKVIQARKELSIQMEKLNDDKLKMENELKLERRKLKIEEDRIKILSTTAAAKLEFAEKKEASMRKHLESEYERIRSTAKQTFHDASETVREQSDIYSRELKELMTYRKALTESIAKNSQIEESQSEMLQEKNNLFKEIKILQDKLVSMGRLLGEKENELTNAIEKRRISEAKLYDLEVTLADQRESESDKQASFYRQKAEYDSALADAQQRLSETKRELNIITEENNAMKHELDQTKRLFQRSQDALLCKTSTIPTSSFHPSVDDGNGFKKYWQNPKSLTATRSNVDKPSDAPMAQTLSNPNHVLQRRSKAATAPAATAGESSGTLKNNELERMNYEDTILEQKVGKGDNNQSMQFDMHTAPDKSFISEITFCTLHHKQKKLFENNSSIGHHQTNEDYDPPLLDDASCKENVRNNIDIADQESVLKSKKNEALGESITITELTPPCNNEEEEDVDKEEDVTLHCTTNSNVGTIVQDKTNEYDSSDFESETKSLLLIDKEKNVVNNFLGEGQKGNNSLCNEGSIPETNHNKGDDGGDDDDDGIPELPSTDELIAIQNMGNKEEEEEHVSILPSPLDYDDGDDDEDDYDDSFEAAQQEQQQIKNQRPTKIIREGNNATSNDHQNESLSTGTGRSSSLFESSASAGIQIYTTSRDKNMVADDEWW